MSDGLPLDPKPVRFRDGSRTAQLGLAQMFPHLYEFAPRRGYSQDRARYRSVEVATVTFVIEGAGDE